MCVGNCGSDKSAVRYRQICTYIYARDAKDAGTSNPRTAASFLFVNYTLVCVIFTGSDSRTASQEARLRHRHRHRATLAEALTAADWQVIQKYFQAGTK